MKKINIIIASIIFSIWLSSLVFAFGVASSYWKGNPLVIAPGETKTTNLNLQNMIGEEDITVLAGIAKGQEIASVKEEKYLVKAGTKDTLVPVTITIPKDTPYDTSYEVTMTFTAMATKGGEGVAFGTGMDTTFDVLVAPKTEKELAREREARNETIVKIIAVLMLAAIAITVIIIILKRRQEAGNLYR